MSVVKINAITVPKERAEELEARFAARAGEVSGSPGFEAFELLRPTDDRDVYLVYTRWAFGGRLPGLGEQPRVRSTGTAPHGDAGSGEQPQRAVGVRRRAARGRAHRLSVPACETLLDFHKVWGYVAIGANALAGVLALRRVAGAQRRAAGGSGSSRSSPSRR